MPFRVAAEQVQFRRALLVVVLVLAVGGEAAGQDAENVIQRACAACHPPLPNGGWQEISREIRTERRWRSILWRMGRQYDAKLTEPEQALLLEFFGSAGIAPSR